jgi:hypothetical protein
MLTRRRVPACYRRAARAIVPDGWLDTIMLDVTDATVYVCRR